MQRRSLQTSAVRVVLIDPICRRLESGDRRQSQSGSQEKPGEVPSCYSASQVHAAAARARARVPTEWCTSPKHHAGQSLVGKMARRLWPITAKGETEILRSEARGQGKASVVLGVTVQNQEISSPCFGLRAIDVEL